MKPFEETADYLCQKYLETLDLYIEALRRVKFLKNDLASYQTRIERKVLENDTKR